MCYWSPIVDVKLVIFVIANVRTIGQQGAEMLSMQQRIVDITSLDDSIGDFRNGLSALFAGCIPQELLITAGDGSLLKLLDCHSLRHYNLLCFQMMTAKFSWDMDDDTPVCAVSESQRAGAKLPPPAPQNDVVNPEPFPASTVATDTIRLSRNCAGKKFLILHRFLSCALFYAQTRP